MTEAWLSSNDTAVINALTPEGYNLRHFRVPKDGAAELPPRKIRRFTCARRRLFYGKVISQAVVRGSIWLPPEGVWVIVIIVITYIIISVAEHPKRSLFFPELPVLKMYTIPGFEFHFNDEDPSTTSFPGE